MITTALRYFSFLTLACVLMLAGCNSKQPGENSTAALPKLSVGGGEGSDDASATGGTVNRGQSDTRSAAAESTTASQAAESKKPTDPELEAIVNLVESNFKAWQEGRPFDFGPTAAKICQRLATDFNQTQLELAHDAGQVFVMTGAYDAARQVYTALAKAAQNSSDSQIAASAREIAQSGLTRLNLLNTSPTIEGTVFNGGQFDWGPYHGKVVLIDFWATWCPHCVEELPDVKHIYEKFHDQGFEVVGISLDDDKQAIADFLDKKQLPWVTLFNDDPAKQGWEGAAMAKQFAIEELPTMMLVDRGGKIVSISARGESLPEQVEKLLGGKQ